MFKKILLLYVILVSLATIVHAETEMPIEEKISEGKQLLTNEVIELVGPESSVDFYYTIENEMAAGNYFVQFYLEHSNLLIEPSAVTLFIDGKPVESYSLTEKVDRIKYELEDDALMEGAHTITLSFSGYIAEGVCPPQDANSNWLTIQINSYMNIPLSSNTSAFLNHYPDKFQQNTQIIVPNTPSLATLQAALEIAQFLPDATIIEENALKTLSSNFIIVGVQGQFQSVKIKSLVEPVDEGLHLATKIIKNKTSYARMMQVIAKDDEALNNIGMLTNKHLVEQLAGKQMTITELPNVQKIQLDETITLDEIGLSSFTIDTNMTTTNTYFYYLPMSKYQLENPSVTVNFKRSNFILAPEESGTVNNQKELIVFLNDVPHAIDLSKHPADELVSVTIPFEPNVIKESQLLAVRFAGNGLIQKNPCITSDQRNWIYIDETSHVNLPVKNKDDQQAILFNQFPFPFMEANETLTIVKAKGASIEELQQLYEALALNTKLTSIKLVEEITAEQLMESHVIFVGGPKEHPILNEATELIVTYTNNKPNLIDEGFVETNTTTYAFVQRNPWNESYGLLVLDRLSAETPYVKEKTMLFLRNNDSPATVLVEQYEIVTNEKLLTKEKDTDEEQDTGWVYAWVAAVVAFVVFALLLMWYFRRRKKTA